MKSKSLLVFDLGNVVLDLNFELFVEGAAKLSTRSVQDISSRYIKGELKQQFERGRTTSDNFLKEMAKWLVWPKSEYDQLKNLWCDIFIRVPEAESSINRFSERYELWLLSDTNELHWQHLVSRFPILQEFSKYFLSYQRGLLKSDPGAFNDLIKEARFFGEQILFFDDLPENIAAAKKAGIDAHQFFNWQSVNQIVQSTTA